MQQKNGTYQFQKYEPDFIKSKVILLLRYLMIEYNGEHCDSFLNEKWSYFQSVKHKNMERETRYQQIL